LIESAIYAFAGGSAGVLAGIWGLDLVRGFNFFWANAKIDVPVLAASFLTALLCGLLFGLTPALHMMRVGAGETLKRSSSKTTIDRKGRRLRSFLMVAEVGAATLLLLLAGLVLRSVVELRTIDTGFRIDDVQTFRTALTVIDVCSANLICFFGSCSSNPCRRNQSGTGYSCVRSEADAAVAE
jgi:hypothetical protein